MHGFPAASGPKPSVISVGTGTDVGMRFSSVLRCYTTESLSRRLYLLSIENHPVLCAGAATSRRPFITRWAFESPLRSRHLRAGHKRLQTGWEMVAAILFCWSSSASGKNKCDGSKSGQSLVTLNRADDSLRALGGFCGVLPTPARMRGESPVNGLSCRLLRTIMTSLLNAATEKYRGHSAFHCFRSGSFLKIEIPDEFWKRLRNVGPGFRKMHYMSG